MTKSARVGGDVDAYCTKCRMDLSHRVIAMVREDVKRVECLTCHGQHNYRRPAAEKERERLAKENKAPRAFPGSASKSSTRSTKSSASRGAAGGSGSSKTSERTGRAYWEKALAGQPMTAFRAYRTSERFDEGDLVRHSRFGDGVVARVVDAGKVEILFEDGPRTMAQGLS